MKSMSRRRLAVVLATGCLLATTPAVTGPAQGATQSHDGVVSADPYNRTPDVLDGLVHGFAQVGDRIIAVGDFTTVQGPSEVQFPRNHIFAFDASSGEIDPTFVPVVNRRVFDVEVHPDGKSVLIAGAFTNVNGAAHTGRIARIDATTGEIVRDFRSRGFGGIVGDIVLGNGQLYAAGNFQPSDRMTHELIAAIHPDTGAQLDTVHFDFEGTQNGGDQDVKSMAMTPDGSRMMVIGNFLSVDGKSRPQAAMIDTSGPTATLDTWATDRFARQCTHRTSSYMRDVDFSPDGRYFAIVTTGAFSGGLASGTLCDTASRWETTGGANQQPTWIDYTGGDTLTAVAVTGAAVYVGGHQRWLNNPQGGGGEAAGAVPRQGIAALDPRNGLPLSWNPGRRRGAGVFGLLVTPTGLWVGSDTANFAGERRQRIAYLPLAGGTRLPADDTGSLPGDIYTLGSQSAASEPVTTVLHRKNVGGKRKWAIDGGPVWKGDTAIDSPYRTSGSRTAAFSTPSGRDPSVPDSTPQVIFATERWDPRTDPPMEWEFPAPVGAELQVRLYFANNCDCTSQAGDRFFDVAVDGKTRLDNYDIVAAAGHKVGTMESISVSSDGTVDIDFLRVRGNPLISGIEILEVESQQGGSTTPDEVRRHRFDGNAVTNSQTVSGDGQAWRSARGAVMIDDTLFTGWANGTFTARGFNNGTFGPATTVELYGLTAFANELQNITGMFFDAEHGRLYYSLAGQSRLYYRYFTPESRVVGAVRFDGPVSGAGIDWQDTSGLILVGNHLYVGSRTDGKLRKVGWQNGAPVGGTVTTVSGPGIDQADWRVRAAFLAVE